jgi:lipoprotein-anchoring transpeptidase ErfK/SrfK
MVEGGTLPAIALFVLAVLMAVPAGAASRRPMEARRPHRHGVQKPGASASINPRAVNDPSQAEPVRPGSSASAILRAQILLARAHFSCGEIDARYGTNLRGAISDFQAAHGLSASGTVNGATWMILNADKAPALLRAPLAPEDVAGPFIPIPEDMIEKAKLPELPYASPLEEIAEKYHTSPALLRNLNPRARFDSAGEEVLAPNVLVPPPAKAASVVVSGSRHTLVVFDAAGKILARYPATTGSEHDPLPLGKWKILGVAWNPPFHYNPDLFWDAKETQEKAHIAPGPNNPVGVAWIDLSREHYGIHGTPEPSQVGKTESHGCIRLTNWDVSELSKLVAPGTPALFEE